MANIYVSQETRELADKVSKLDKRTQEGEINYLLTKRLEEIESAE